MQHKHISHRSDLTSCSFYVAPHSAIRTQPSKYIVNTHPASRTTMQSSVGARLILGAFVLATLCIATTWCRTIDAGSAAAAAASGFGGGGLNGNGNNNGALNGNNGVAAVPMPAICEPGFVEKMPAHIRKVCAALDSAAQLSSALYAYLHNQHAGEYRQHISVLVGRHGRYFCNQKTTKTFYKHADTDTHTFRPPFAVVLVRVHALCVCDFAMQHPKHTERHARHNAMCVACGGWL